MSIRDGKVTVLNYNDFVLSIPTETRTYILDPATDDDIPVLANISFSDLEYVNSHSNAIRTGLISFKPEQKEEVYKELSIFDWEDILSNKEIKNILLNPTMDGLKKLIDIKDVVTFERVRSIITNMKNSNVYDISDRVIRIVNTRYTELRQNILKSQIILQSKDTIKKVEAEDVENIKTQNAQLIAQMAEMQKMMATLMENQNNSNGNDDEIKKSKVETAVVDIKKDETPKKAGRPSKADK